ncbi:MAG: response regulator [Chloroflexi bacterium]|nr:response regulator [Chloroflexota bacterium]
MPDNTSQASILVVDDHHQNLHLLREMLTQQGYTVWAMADGPRALASLEEKLADLILLDIMMPDMDGYQVCARLKTDERTRDIPVIFISAVSQVFDKVKAFSVGGVDYITKPFQVEEVLARVKTHLTLRQLNDELERRVTERTTELEAEISRHSRTETELKKRQTELITLNAIMTTLSQSRDLDHILTTTLDIVLPLAGASAGCVHLLRKESRVLSLAVQRGFSQEIIEKTRIIRLSDIPSKLWSFDGSLSNNWSVLSPYLDAVDWGNWRCLHIAPLVYKNTVLGIQSVFDLAAFAMDGSECPMDDLDAGLVQILNAIGHQVGIAVENEQLIRDTSEIKIVQELDRLRSELIANVSHELRTPLGLIKAAATTLLLKEDRFDRQTRQTLLRGIDEETDRLEHIVNNLLNVSRMEYGQLSLNRSVIDVGQLIKQTVAAMRVHKEPGQPSVQIVHDLPAYPLTADVDAKRIEQVLRNLLDNAVKYSPNGGVITVRGSGNKPIGTRSPQMIISVSDQGIGIPSTDMEKIFERFYRVRNETTRGTSGTGLGLAICRGIVDAHGGQIWGKSELGKGSEFCFTIPVKDTESGTT